MEKIEVSIIIPVYNSFEILDELNQRILKSLKNVNLSENFELIMINDFSKDKSWDKIKYLSSKYNYIKGINLSDNFGQHNAIMAGLNNCKGEYVITIDDDLQHPPEFFPEIIKKLENYDVCYTNYRNRKHNFWKKIVSKINNIVSSFLLNKPLNIYLSSFRGLKREVVLDIIKFNKPNVYIDGIIIRATKNIGIISVNHDERKSGKSNYNLRKLFILWSNMIIDLRFYPIRISSIFGFILKFFVILLRKKENKPQYEILEQVP